MSAVLRAPGDDYLSLLRESELETERLIAGLTIKVSRFYRNAAVFDFLAAEIVPALRRRFHQPLRVWSAGCARGEEAYTLAMLLSDDDAQVRATDLDEAALVAGRSGRYEPAALAEAPEAFAAALLQGGGQSVEVPELLRRRVEFIRHDLGAADQPPDGAPFHLICCRNVLIYFSRPLQQRVMRLLVRSLAPGGVLCLGEAEWPVDESESFEAIDKRRKLFRRLEAQERER
jgi:chemotaxis protein methyltransferase CheR